MKNVKVPLCKVSNLLMTTKFKKRDTETMSHLSLKIVPPFLPGIQKITPTYGHTKYNDKLADFKDNHKHPECYKACLLLDFLPH